MTDTAYSGTVNPGSSPPAGSDDTLGKIKDAASQALDTAKHEAGHAAASMQDKAKDTLEQGKQAASHTLVDFAGAIRKAGDELAQHDQSMAGRLVKQAADGLENLSHAVADKRPDELIDALRDLGRRNPGAVLAGSVLIGLALGRFAKSSAKPDTDGSAGTYPAPSTMPKTPMPLSSGMPTGSSTWSGSADQRPYGQSPVSQARPVGVTPGSNGNSF
jgi:hypothetical protein